MRYQVNLIVQTYVNAETPDAAAEKAEQTVQRLLDRSAKRLGAVVGADYADVSEAVVEPTEALDKRHLR